MKPRLFVANVSQCAESYQTFCTKNDGYPHEYMQQLLQSYLHQYNRFFDVPAIASGAESRAKTHATTVPLLEIPVRKMDSPITVVEDRFDEPQSSFDTTPMMRTTMRTPTMMTSMRPRMRPIITTPTMMTSVNDDSNDEIELCDTVGKVIYPTSAKSETGIDLFIFNSDDHKQGVHVTICQDVGKPCDDFVVLRNNYVSECKQQKIYRELLSLSPQGTPIKERFEFPASCTCILRRVKLSN